MSVLPNGFSSDVGFTETVKAIQARKGSRDTYARMEQGGGWQTEISSDLATYISNQRSVFLSTVNGAGQPYIQHRGGPRGFLHVLDKTTIAFADFKGNRQFISQGNLTENPKAFLFLIDYLNKTRVKIWGEAEIVEDDPEMLAALMPHAAEYRAAPEQVVLFRVKAWDVNCPQHIPQRLDREDVEELLRDRDRKITLLEEQIRQLKARA